MKVEVNFHLLNTFGSLSTRYVNVYLFNPPRFFRCADYSNLIADQIDSCHPLFDVRHQAVISIHMLPKPLNISFYQAIWNSDNVLSKDENSGNTQKTSVSLIQLGTFRWKDFPKYTVGPSVVASILERCWGSQKSQKGCVDRSSGGHDVITGLQGRECKTRDLPAWNSRCCLGLQ